MEVQGIFKKAKQTYTKKPTKQTNKNKTPGNEKRTMKRQRDQSNPNNHATGAQEFMYQWELFITI